MYEALPQALADQLETLRYAQTRRAINAVLERLDRAVSNASGHPPPASLRKLDQDIESAIGRLPLTSQYGAECFGIRASSRKRLAQAAFKLATQGSDPGEQWRDSYDLLNEAYLDYERAARAILVAGTGPVQRVATLHWVLVQVESLALILGRDRDEGRWTAARLSAQMHLDHPVTEEHAWAHGSLAELYLIRLGDPDLTDAQREFFSDHAVKAVRELTMLYPRRDEFPVRSTRSQFQRYVDWWGTSDFESGPRERGLSRRAPWDGELGVIAVAKRLVSLLHRDGRTPGGSPPPPSSGLIGGSTGAVPGPSQRAIGKS